MEKIHHSEETLPVSVEGTRDVERVRPGFVVSSGAKSIHKAAVGKRGLHKETAQRGREGRGKTNGEATVCTLGDGCTGPRPKCVSVCGRCHSLKVLTSTFKE